MTPRRDLLALTASAVATTTVLPAAAGADGQAKHPDADLIRLCAEHRANSLAYCGSTWPASDWENDPAWIEYSRTYELVCAAKPQTIEGVLAKARLAKAEAIGPSGDETVEFCDAPTEWAWQVASDLLRLHGEMPA